MNYNVMKEISVPSAKVEGMIEVPFLSDNGFMKTATAFAVENYKYAVQGGMSTPDHEYEFDKEKDKLAEGLSEANARIFKNGNYSSHEEAMRNLGYFQRSEYLTKSAVEQGWDGMAGMVVGQMADWTVLLGGLGSIGALKMANNSRKLMAGMDKLSKAGATAGQVKAADLAVKGTAGSLAFDAGMMAPRVVEGRADAQEVEDSILMGLAFTGAVGGALSLRSIARSNEMFNTSTRLLNEGRNPLGDLQQAGREVDSVRKDADAVLADPMSTQYIKPEGRADKLAAPSRHSMTSNTEVESVNELSNRLFQDPTYQRTNVKENIQAITADVEADKWTYSVEGELGEALYKGRKAFFKTPEGKAWRRQNGISVLDRVLSKPINDRLGYDIHRRLYMGERIEDMPAGMREMAQAIDTAHRKTFEQMKRYGVLGTEDLDHVTGHMRRMHDDQAYRDLAHSYGDIRVGEEAITSSLSEAIFRGAAKEGKAMTQALSRRLALILQHRVMAVGEDKMALEHFLTSPNVFYKEALDHLKNTADAEALTREAFGAPTWKPGEAAAKQKSDSNKYTMLRRRIPMDLSTPVPNKKNKWGEDFMVGDLMVTDAFELTHRYTRRGMGAAALAKQGLNSPEAIEQMMSKLRSDAKLVTDGQKAKDALIRLEEGIRRIQGVGAMEEVTGATAKLAAISAMLGKHAIGTALGGSGIAAMGELARVVNRTGFKALLDMLPALRNASDKELLEMFKEFGYYYGNSRMLAYFSHIEDFGSNAMGKMGALASQSAQTALRFSGLSMIDQLSRQSALIGWARRLEKQVKAGTVSPKDFRLSEMGWKPETFEAISGYIKAHGMKMDNWRLPDGRQDLETIEKFTSGAHKVVSENITRMQAGESNAFVDGPVGSMFLQFRKIVYATYNKSLVRGLSQPDSIAASNLVAGIIGALIVNEMRNAAKTAGMDEQRRDEYMKKYSLRYAMMNDGELLQPVTATLSYTPEFGPLLELLSLFSSQFFGIDVRGRHQSGPQAIFQVPSLQLAENMLRTTGGLAASPFSDEADWDDIKRRGQAVTTLQNWYLTPAIMNILENNKE